MDPLIVSALIGAGSSLVGGMMAGKGAKAQNRANEIATAKQMAFQERMSNTQASANIMNTVANTQKTSQETKILQDTSGSILGKTIDAIEKLIKGDSNVSDFIQGKSLTKFMEGTDIDKFLRDITNAKEATTDKPLRILIQKSHPSLRKK